jgi:hypothetical protein
MGLQKAAKWAINSKNSGNYFLLENWLHVAHMTLEYSNQISLRPNLSHLGIFTK